METISSCAERILKNRTGCSREEADAWMALPETRVWELMEWANRIRERFFNRSVSFCSIVNAKAGGCSENCSFCAQSGHFKTDSPRYPLMDPRKILEAAGEASRNGASRFGIVIATKGIGYDPPAFVEQVCQAIRAIRDQGEIIPDASLGLLTEEVAWKLKEAGLRGYNHNLETSKRHFPKICTTHTFDDRLETLRIARKVGFMICSGGIFGMGETNEDRVDLAFSLKEAAVDTVPINFLIPIPGTPLADLPPLRPLECLKIIAVYRMILPEKDLRICGGREQNLRDLQSLIYRAGATAALMGNYLTRIGNPPEDDRRMIADLQLELCRFEPDAAKGSPAKAQTAF
jgi:biotin synthase